MKEYFPLTCCTRRKAVVVGGCFVGFIDTFVYKGNAHLIAWCVAGTTFAILQSIRLEHQASGIRHQVAAPGAHQLYFRNTQVTLTATDSRSVQSLCHCWLVALSAGCSYGDRTHRFISECNVSIIRLSIPTTAD